MQDTREIPRARVDWGTLQITLSLERTFDYIIRRHISFLGIDTFTGASNTVYLQLGEEGQTRQEIEEGKWWQWPYHRNDVHIVNTTVQSGAILRLTIGGAGSTGRAAKFRGVARLENIAGAVINPAQEDGNLASILTNTGDIAGILTNTGAIVNQGANRTSFYSARVVVGTTAAQLAAQAIPSNRSAVLYADAGNTGLIAYGPSSGVTTTANAGLKAGQGIELAVDNLNRIYVIASVADQVLHVAVEV